MASGSALVNISSKVEAAISAAVGIARDHGITVDRPATLRSTNNAVAWLHPAPVVAKVGVGRNPRLSTELNVARDRRHSPCKEQDGLSRLSDRGELLL